MDVRIVRVAMRKRLVSMLMTMRLGFVPGERMFMLMMGVVPVAVGVYEGLVGVLVIMSFCEMQPDSYGHQDCRDPQCR